LQSIVHIKTSRKQLTQIPQGGIMSNINQNRGEKEDFYLDPNQDKNTPKEMQSSEGKNPREVQQNEQQSSQTSEAKQAGSEQSSSFSEDPTEKQPTYPQSSDDQAQPAQQQSATPEGRPISRTKGQGRTGARGTAAMDPKTRQEVARKGGLAVSRNKQHMAEIGRKGGQTVSKNREHMAAIGRKGGEASRGHR